MGMSQWVNLGHVELFDLLGYLPKKKPARGVLEQTCRKVEVEQGPCSLSCKQRVTNSYQNRRKCLVPWPVKKNRLIFFPLFSIIEFKFALIYKLGELDFIPNFLVGCGKHVYSCHLAQLQNGQK